MEKMKTPKVKPLTVLFQEIIKRIEKMEKDKDKEGYTTKDYLDALANRLDIVENEIGKIKTDIYAIDERAHNTDEEIARLDADIDAIYSGTLADDEEEDKENEVHKVGGTDSEEEEEEEDPEWWLCEDKEEESKHKTINMNITIGADSPLNEDFFERLYDLVEKSKKKKTTK